MEVLKRLCLAIRGKLSDRACKRLIIVDDVWPEDFELFSKRVWLGLDTLHGGSVFVVTSRGRGLVTQHGGNYSVVALKSVDLERAQRILRQHALLTAAEVIKEQDDSVRMCSCMT